MSAQEITEVMDYIERLDPKIRARMVGASDAEIATLEDITEVALCDSHRTWLRHLGNTPFNALKPLFLDDSLTVADVREYYDLIGHDNARKLGRAALLYHRDGIEKLYTVQPDDPTADPPLKDVAFGDDGVPIHDDEVYYPSFATWFVTKVFTVLFAFRREYQFSIVPPIDLIRAVEDELRADLELVAARLGFTRVPQSRGTALLYERGDLGLSFGKTLEISAFSISVDGNDEKETRRILELLHDRHGGSITRYPRNPAFG
ncbi:MAG: hypothetical protein R3A51_11995 [Nannocystaceae bacterium]